MAGFSTLVDFPICVPEVSSGEVGPNTKYPVGVDIETLMKWVYRVKGWNISINCSVSSSATSPDLSVSASVSSNSVNAGGLATVETEMVCALDTKNAPINDVTDSQSDSGDEGQSVFASATIYHNFTEFGSNIVRVGSLYYPYLNIECVAGGTASATWSDPEQPEPSIHGKTEQIGTFPPISPGDVNDSMSMQIDGVSFTVGALRQESSFEQGAGVTASVSVGSVSIIMTPSSYWPYDPGDGDGPIYNSSTGAELRDPFSVQ